MKVIPLLCALFVAACYCSSNVGVLEPLEFRSVESLELDTLQARESFSMNYSPGSGPAGTVITISYSSSQVSNAWIGLFASGSSTTSTFKYLTANSGQMTLSTAGLAAGSYKLYFVYNSYIQIQASYTVTGGSGGTSSTSGNPTSTSGKPSTSGTSGNPTTSGTSGTSGSSNPGGDASTWLNEHNKRRAGVSPNLSWSNKLAASALNWAKTMASKCSMYHSGKYGVGENIAYGYGTIAQVMTAWADSEKKYYSNGQCSGGVCGHYTQVMWKSTTLVGCGVAYCGSSPYYACQYIRPGNCNGYNFLQDNSACPYFDDSQV